MTELLNPPATPVRRAVPVKAPADIDWRDIPVFIVNRNRCAALQRLVQWLLDGGTRRVVILDNASTYAPLLDYYAALPDGARLMRLDQNFGPYVFWQQGVHQVIDTPYVVTDSDVVPADFCPTNLIARLLGVLQRYPDASKVGPALRIDNLPDSYIEADTVRRWESQFWEHPVAPGLFAAPIDTTFALYPPHAEFSNDGRSLRLGHPFIAEHTPWYAEEHALSDEERYYREHTSATFSNWSVEKKDSWVRKSPRVLHFEQRAKVLSIDGGRDHIPGWINAGPQRPGGPVRDLPFELDRCASEPIALADSSVDGILLTEGLEGVRDLWALMGELWRVARPGAVLLVRAVHGKALGAWTSAGQVRAFGEGSFSFFAQPSCRGLTSYAADWQLKSVQLIASEASDGDDAASCLDRGLVTDLAVRLVAVKPARLQAGAVTGLRIVPELVRDARIDPAFEPV